MSNSPYILDRARTGYKFGNAVMIDSMLRDGLTDAFSDEHMGLTAERVAGLYQITRKPRSFAAQSQKRYGAAVAAGRFRDEIVAVDKVMQDEPPRPETTMSRSARSRPHSIRRAL